MESLTVACPSPTPAARAAPHFIGVYWKHFWNRQRYTRTHLFRDYPERGYANVSPEEGKSLCGEHIGDDWHEAPTDARNLCKRCQRVRVSIEAAS